jgi:hypothetical protein
MAWARVTGEIYHRPRRTCEAAYQYQNMPMLGLTSRLSAPSEYHVRVISMPTSRFKNLAGRKTYPPPMETAAPELECTTGPFRTSLIS